MSPLTPPPPSPPPPRHVIRAHLVAAPSNCCFQPLFTHLTQIRCHFKASPRLRHVNSEVSETAGRMSPAVQCVVRSGWGKHKCRCRGVFLASSFLHRLHDWRTSGPNDCLFSFLHILFSLSNFRRCRSFGIFFSRASLVTSEPLPIDSAQDVRNEKRTFKPSRFGTPYVQLPNN